MFEIGPSSGEKSGRIAGPITSESEWAAEMVSSNGIVALLRSLVTRDVRTFYYREGRKAGYYNCGGAKRRSGGGYGYRCQM